MSQYIFTNLVIDKGRADPAFKSYDISRVNGIFSTKQAATTSSHAFAILDLYAKKELYKF